MRIVDLMEMKKIEELSASECYFDEKLIVENVGILASQWMLDYLSDQLIQSEIIFLIGPGNNGADGLSFARHLSLKGFNPHVFFLFSDNDSSIELRHQKKMTQAFGLKTFEIKEVSDLESFVWQLDAPKVFVDAIFGTGVRLPLSQFIYDIIHLVNKVSSQVISLDVPTGIDGQSGLTQGNSIDAHVTLAIGLPKIGYYQGQGPKQVGEVKVVPVGFPTHLIEGGDKFLLDLSEFDNLAESRSKFGDKKLFGHTLIIGGSHGLTGAPVMASIASLKVGAGLVTAATWEPQYQEMIYRLTPEIMTGYLPLDITKWGRLLNDINKYDSIVIGPGFARSTRSRKAVLEILNNFMGPVILDADAINVLNLQEDADVFRIRSAPTVLTPHFGEFSRFAGVEYEEILNRPYQHLRNVIERINCSVILKGPCTFLGFPNGETYFNYYPNNGMATAGVGDVLAGILGGLIAQEGYLKKKNSLYDLYENMTKTLKLGVLIHTMSGKISQEKYGERSMTATSLIDSFSDVFKKFQL